MAPERINHDVEAARSEPSQPVGEVLTLEVDNVDLTQSAIGGGGLGTFIFRGIATADLTTVLAGAVPAAVMAIIADEVLEWAERRYSV